MSQTDEQHWIKVARVFAKMPYPPVSAWEFEALKSEEAVRERLKTSTIYMIGQRPLIWFDNVVTDDSGVTFEITDGELSPLKCRLEPVRAGLCKPGEILDVEFGFHRDARSDTQPLRNVASIRFFDGNDAFKVWWSPQKLLFEAVVRGLRVSIDGDASELMKFEVHYIGQAFSQKVWDRLKTHEKYQGVLIKEDIRGAGHARPSLEITLFMLEIDGVDELASRAEDLEDEQDLPPPILHRFSCDPTDAARLAFFAPWVAPQDKSLTTEVEAMLINLFKPVYNSVLFENYPVIKGGLRDLGFTDTELQLERFPFTLVNKAGESMLGDADAL